MFVTTILAIAALASPALGLDEAIQHALAASPELKAAEARVEASQAREVQAAAGPNPNVSLIVDQVPFSNPIAGNYMAGISQPLLLGDQLGARVALARTEIRLSELDRDLVRLAVAAALKEAYAEALFAGVNEGLARNVVLGADAALAATRLRLHVGEVAPIAVAQAEVESGRARRDARAASNARREAEARLNVRLGRQAEHPLALTPQASKPFTVPALTSLRTAALASRVELRRAAIAIEQESLQRRAALAGLWTGTQVMGAVGAVGGQPGLSATLSLPIPFYRQQGEIAAAEAERRRAEAEALRLRSAIIVEVETAYRAAIDAADELRAFRALYVPQAERLEAASARRLKAGEGAPTEAAEASRSLLRARSEQAQAELFYRRTLARLEQAVGRELPLVEVNP